MVNVWFWMNGFDLPQQPVFIPYSNVPFKNRNAVEK